MGKFHLSTPLLLGVSGKNMSKWYFGYSSEMVESNVVVPLPMVVLIYPRHQLVCITQ